MNPLSDNTTWRNVETGWARGLGVVKSNSRWVLYATTRNSPGPGGAERSAGVHGVRRNELLDGIWNALERAHEFLVAQGRTPLPAAPPRVQIYVFAVDDPEHGCGDPLTTQLLFSTPSGIGNRRLSLGTVITLPSRSSEPNWESELAQTLAAVVHELSHCLNIQVLPLRPRPLTRLETQEAQEARKQMIDSWRWLDEGMAVAAEASFAVHELQLQQAGDPRALSMTNDWLRFALDWVDRPERSLDDPRQVYQAAFFVRYLHRMMGGPAFLNKVWSLSERVWGNDASKDCSALAMLAQSLYSLTPSQVFCSATLPDVFASGYCLDSYFLNDPQSNAYEPEVSARFRERAVTRTWRIGMPEEWPDGKTEKYKLPGLACRYFRLMPPEKARRLLVRVLPPPGTNAESILALKAEIAFAQPDPSLCRRHPDGTPIREPLSGTGELSCEIRDFSKKNCDHAVLVVTNCDYKHPESTQLPPAGYEQQGWFCVDARLI